MTRPQVKDADFVGREAYLKQRERGPGHRALHADRRRPHLGQRAASATCSAVSRSSTRDGEPLVDGHGHRPYVTIAGSAPSLGKHLLMAYLPPDRAVVGNRLAVELHGGALPGHGRGGRRHAAVRPGQRADQGCSAWRTCWSASSGCPAPSGADPARPTTRSRVDARHVGWTVSPHEECAVELATQVASAHRRHRHGAHRRGQPTPSSSCATRSRSGCTAAVLVEADAERFGPADVAAAIAEVVRAHEAAGTGYDLVLLGNDAADTGDFQVAVRLAYALERPVLTGISLVRGRGRAGARRRRRPRRRGDLRAAAAGGGGGDGGRCRAALPVGHGPDEGQEGRDRDA